MPSSNIEIKDRSKEQNPMIGLIGFIVIVVVGGLSFAISGPITAWLQNTRLMLGASGIQLLPLKFPENWSPIADQMVVTVGLFLIVFAVVMTLLFMFMKPASQDETSVSLDSIRKEAQARRKR